MNSLKVSKKEIIAGNWKMHKTIGEAKAFVEALLPKAVQAKSSVWIAPPFTAIAACVEKAKGSSIAIGAQTMSQHEEGAFTGEISAKMLQEAGASFVILGHSERRTLFGETDVVIRQKVERAVRSNIACILCIGETESEREKGEMSQVLKKQITQCLEGLTAHDLEKLVIAYEPVWAIGTGKSATAEMAQEAHAMIRAELAEQKGKSWAQNVSLLYGGSVKPGNIRSLLDQSDIDGALVGGASLIVESFIDLIDQVK